MGDKKDYPHKKKNKLLIIIITVGGNINSMKNMKYEANQLYREAF